MLLPFPLKVHFRLEIRLLVVVLRFTQHWLLHVVTHLWWRVDNLLMETCHVLRTVESDDRWLVAEVWSLHVALWHFCQQLVHFVILLMNDTIAPPHILELPSQLSHNPGQLTFTRLIGGFVSLDLWVIDLGASKWGLFFQFPDSVLETLLLMLQLLNHQLSVLNLSFEEVVFIPQAVELRRSVTIDDRHRLVPFYINWQLCHLLVMHID